MTVQAIDLAGLHKAAFPDAPWSVADFDAFLRDPTICIIARPHGFAMIRVVVDEAELLTLAVIPQAQGKGLGVEVLQAALAAAQARGACRLFLEVAADNIAARALYARAGFAPTGLRRGYYPRAGLPAVDALLLARTLA